MSMTFEARPVAPPRSGATPTSNVVLETVSSRKMSSSTSSSSSHSGLNNLPTKPASIDLTHRLQFSQIMFI